MPNKTKQNPENGVNTAGELILAITINLFAVFVIVESFRMPARGHLGIICYPSFVPLLAGILLFVLTLVLALVMIRRGGYKYFGDWLKNIRAEEDNRRFLAILATVLIYVVVLLGRVPFVLATLVFHGLLFTYLKVGSIWKIILYTALATILVSVVLPRLFDMPVP
jgi:hypothetical protein